jgi:hypothetical protein
VFQAGEIVGAISILGTVAQLPRQGTSPETTELLAVCTDLTDALGSAEGDGVHGG